MKTWCVGLVLVFGLVFSGGAAEEDISDQILTKMSEIVDQRGAEWLTLPPMLYGSPQKFSVTSGYGKFVSFVSLKRSGNAATFKDSSGNMYLTIPTAYDGLVVKFDDVKFTESSTTCDASATIRSNSGSNAALNILVKEKGDGCVGIFDGVTSSWTHMPTVKVSSTSCPAASETKIKEALTQEFRSAMKAASKTFLSSAATIALKEMGNIC